MKTAMYTLAGLMCLLTSCVDDDKDLSVPPTGNTTDLVIPDGLTGLQHAPSPLRPMRRMPFPLPSIWTKHVPNR